MYTIGQSYFQSPWTTNLKNTVGGYLYLLGGLRVYIITTYCVFVSAPKCRDVVLGSYGARGMSLVARAQSKL